MLPRPENISKTIWAVSGKSVLKKVESKKFLENNNIKQHGVFFQKLILKSNFSFLVEWNPSKVHYFVFMKEAATDISFKQV